MTKKEIRIRQRIAKLKKQLRGKETVLHTKKGIVWAKGKDAVLVKKCCKLVSLMAQAGEI